VEATSEAEKLARCAHGELHRRYAILRPKVVDELMGDELVIINFDTGKYHGIRGVGVEVWHLLEAGLSVAELGAELSRRYRGIDDGARLAVGRFIAELERQRLIVSQAEGAPGPIHSPSEHDHDTTRAFAFPELDTRDDLQDYLALDPIHDVDERGWPNVRR
jgi:hypothetical protein